MKVNGTLKKTQRLEGSISKQDLLDLVRSTFIIPDGADADFHVVDTGSRSGLVQHQLGWQPSPVVQVSDVNPVKFIITWSLPVGKDEQG